MTTVEWARGVKQDLVRLQNETGIPAAFAAAQFCHESYDAEYGLSGLARNDHNYAGLKFAEWERAYGCTPVWYDTGEDPGDGSSITINAAFCHCPDWATWLRVYAALLTGRYYASALQYGHDPLLYGYHVWRAGWATGTRYIEGIAHWMAVLWDDYQDTIPLPPWRQVEVYVYGKALPEKAVLMPHGRTFAPVRALGEAMGGTVRWDGQKVEID